MHIFVRSNLEVKSIFILVHLNVIKLFEIILLLLADNYLYFYMSMEIVFSIFTSDPQGESRVGTLIHGTYCSAL